MPRCDRCTRESNPFAIPRQRSQMCTACRKRHAPDVTCGEHRATLATLALEACLRRHCPGMACEQHAVSLRAHSVSRPTQSFQMCAVCGAHHSATVKRARRMTLRRHGRCSARPAWPRLRSEVANVTPPRTLTFLGVCQVSYVRQQCRQRRVSWSNQRFPDRASASRRTVYLRRSRVDNVVRHDRRSQRVAHTA